MFPDKVFIIAEAGVNHNGSLKTAKRLVDAAFEAGADAVKFQTFKPELCVSHQAPKAEYQKSPEKKQETQFEMLKRLELSLAAHRLLIGHCQKRGIAFLSSAFDLASIDLLNRLGLEIFKVPSSEINNLPYLRLLGPLNKIIIMSTGMSDIKEAGQALDILTASGTKKKNIAILHATTDYPASPQDVNLNAMLAIRDKFQVTVGYSDHTQGIEIAVAAVALGARIIEKHFTLDKNMPGPDHRASLPPQELSRMVAAIRNTEMALGDGVKRPADSEKKNMLSARKSIIVAKPIKKGDLFTAQNLAVKRPGGGISPMRWDEVLGKAAKRNFRADEFAEI